MSTFVAKPSMKWNRALLVDYVKENYPGVLDTFKKKPTKVQLMAYIDAHTHEEALSSGDSSGDETASASASGGTDESESSPLAEHDDLTLQLEEAHSDEDEPSSGDSSGDETTSSSGDSIGDETMSVSGGTDESEPLPLTEHADLTLQLEEAHADEEESSSGDSSGDETASTSASGGTDEPVVAPPPEPAPSPPAERADLTLQLEETHADEEESSSGDSCGDETAFASASGGTDEPAVAPSPPEPAPSPPAERADLTLQLEETHADEEESSSGDSCDDKTTSASASGGTDEPVVAPSPPAERADLSVENMAVEAMKKVVKDLKESDHDLAVASKHIHDLQDKLKAAQDTNAQLDAELETFRHSQNRYNFTTASVDIEATKLRRALATALALKDSIKKQLNQCEKKLMVSKKELDLAYADNKVCEATANAKILEYEETIKKLQAEMAMLKKANPTDAPTRGETERLSKMVESLRQRLIVAESGERKNRVSCVNCARLEDAATILKTQLRVAKQIHTEPSDPSMANVTSSNILLGMSQTEPTEAPPTIA